MTVLLIDRVMRTPFECNYYMGEHLMYHIDPFSLQTGLRASNYHSCTAWEAKVLHKFFKLLLGCAHFCGHKANVKSCACSLRLKVLRDLNEVSFKEKVRELNHVCVAMDTTVCLIVPVDHTACSSHKWAVNQKQLVRPCSSSHLTSSEVNLP